METLISIRDLKRVYKMGGEKVYALNGINLDIYRGEILCLLGTSGSGKSTLLNMIAGLDRPSAGSIKFGKVDFTKLNEAQITHFRQLNVGFVFQSYNLIPTLNALDNVALGLIFKGVPKAKRDALAKDILEKVGLGDRIYHKPSEMSGGQQQRVSIARAFVDKPKIVFADEPTGNLDTKTSFEIMDLMCQMARDHDQTLIIVTHDVETSIYADRIVELRDGVVIREETNKAKIPRPSEKDTINEEEISKDHDDKTLGEDEDKTSPENDVGDTSNDESDNFCEEDSSSESEKNSKDISDEGKSLENSDKDINPSEEILDKETNEDFTQEKIDELEKSEDENENEDN